jgi:prefoldin subunit 5
MPVQQTSPDLLNQQQDYLQSQFAHLHQQITQTWFLTA